MGKDLPEIPVIFAETPHLQAIQNLLQKVQLPIEGVEDQLENFLLLFDEGSLIGCVGIEKYGQYGLLRSLAIDPTMQGKGLGTILVQSIEDRARDLKIKEIYGLTLTADQFFVKQKFSRISRDEVPKEIQCSKEFSSICPKSSIVLKKKINN
jgi:amino-acid N-acetyltransferase